MLPASDKTLVASYAKAYKRFADANINVLSSSAAENRVLVVIEYSYERPRDGKLIWPKIAIESETLGGALAMAEETVKAIREA